jgi:hypothetical protein
MTNWHDLVIGAAGRIPFLLAASRRGVNVVDFTSIDELRARGRVAALTSSSVDSDRSFTGRRS